MSDLASSSDAQEAKALAASKRKATDAGLPGTGARPHKSVKRRASKACQCCKFFVTSLKSDNKIDIA